MLVLYIVYIPPHYINYSDLVYIPPLEAFVADYKLKFYRSKKFKFEIEIPDFKKWEPGSHLNSSFFHSNASIEENSKKL